MYCVIQIFTACVHFLHYVDFFYSDRLRARVITFIEESGRVKFKWKYPSNEISFAIFGVLPEEISVSANSDWQLNGIHG